jgi:hypothetical protein
MNDFFRFGAMTKEFSSPSNPNMPRSSWDAGVRRTSRTNSAI